MGKHRKTFGNGRHRRPAAKGPTGLGSVAAGGLPAAALFVAGASAAEAADSQSTSAGDYQSDDSRPSAPDDTQYTDQSGDPTSSAADDSQYTGYQPDQSNNPADSTTDDSQPVAGSGRNDDADPPARRGCRAKNPAHIGSRGTQERPASSPRPLEPSPALQISRWTDEQDSSRCRPQVPSVGPRADRTAGRRQPAVRPSAAEGVHPPSRRPAPNPARRCRRGQGPLLPR